MGLSCLLGVSIPQITEKSPLFFENWKLKSPVVYYLVDLLQLNRVYTSSWFLILVAIVSLSLSWFVFEQLKLLVRSGRSGNRPVSLEAFNNYSEIQVDANPHAPDLSSRIKSIIRRKGYRLSYTDKENNILSFCKNRFGRWGTFLFHLGLLFIIFAALYALAFQKRGFVGLIQTETFPGRNEDWQEKSLGAFAKDFDLGFKVYLKEFKPTYWENGKLKGIESVLVFTGNDGMVEEHVLPVSNPVTYHGVRICQSLDYGYALTFLLERPLSDPLVTHFMLDSPSKKTKPFIGKTDFPTTDYIFDMKFYPDIKEPSFYLNNPGVDLVIKEKGVVKFNDRVLFSEKVFVGENAITFAQIHYWSGLFFVRSQGMTLVYSGFFLSVFGALIIYFMPFKEIHVKVNETKGHRMIAIGGQCKKYQVLFAEEFNEILAELETTFPSGIEKIKAGDKYGRDATVTI